MGHHTFFYAGLADEHAPSVVLLAYKLAKYWGQHPNSFLALSRTEIYRHARRTEELTQHLRALQEWNKVN